jgi:hypothetical protein
MSRNDTIVRRATAIVRHVESKRRVLETASSMTTAHVRRSAIALLFGTLAQGCGWWFDDGDGDDDYDGDSDGDVTPPPPDGPPPLAEDPFTEECIPAQWYPESPPPWGTPASIDLRGTQVRVDTSLTPHVNAVAAPLRIEPADPELPVIAFGDATVEDPATDTVHEGTLVVVGTGIVATAGIVEIDALTELSIADDNAWLRPWAVEQDDGMRPALGETAPAEHQAAIDATSQYELDVQALELTGFDEAYVVTDAGIVPLTPPFSVTASVVYWAPSSRVGAHAVDTSYSGELFLGIAPVAGTLTTEDGETEEPPMAIFTRDARLDVGPDHIRTLIDAPVRQALGVDDALVESEVELRSCQADTLVMYQGQTRILQMAYRQSTGLTDAVFSEVIVEDENGTVLASRITLDATLPPQLTAAADAHPDAAWGQGIIDFVEAWVEVTTAVTEGLVCVFTFGLACPDSSSGSSGPTPLSAYPAWMQPGAVGSFELEITGPHAVGEHDLVVRIVGQNYETTLPLHVIVQ